MEQVTVSCNGQIALPKQVRDALNLVEGSRLSLEIRGQEIVLSKSGAWRKLQGAAGDLMKAFAAFRVEEREREDSRP
jgi:AbrB family looped-hinge helix DNA binding protein